MDKEPKKPQSTKEFLEGLVPLSGALIAGRTAGSLAAKATYKATKSKGLASIAFITATAGTADASYSPLKKLSKTVKDKFEGSEPDAAPKPKSQEDEINDHIKDILDKINPENSNQGDNDNKPDIKKGPKRNNKGPK